MIIQKPRERVVSVAPIQIEYTHPAIKALQDKIALEIKGIVDENQEHYVAGLSDALGIITEYISKELTVGNIYYVIVPKDDISNKIVKMRLYKITLKKKPFYSFTENINSSRDTNDLTLSNQNSIEMRVFKTKEEAESHQNIMVWRSENKAFGRR